MTPINLEAALNLPLPEVSTYRAPSARLEPNNCFDGHLQRASSSPAPADGRSSNASRDSSRSEIEPGQSSSLPVEGPESEDAQVVDNTASQETDEAVAGDATVDDQSADDSDGNNETDTDEVSTADAALVAQPVVILPGAKQEQKPDAGSIGQAKADAEGKAAEDVKPSGHAASNTELAAGAETAAGAEAAAQQAVAEQATNTDTTRTSGKRKPADKPKDTISTTKPVEQSESGQQLVTDSAVAVNEVGQQPDQERPRKSRASRGSAVDNDASPRQATAVEQAPSATTAKEVASNAEAALAATAIAKHVDDRTNAIATSSHSDSQPATQSIDGAGRAISGSSSDAASQPAQRLVGASSSKAATGGSAISEVDRVRFVQRVARAVQSAGDRGGSMRLRLSPPELGSLRLEVSIKNGTMTARIEAESASARSLLLDNLPELKQRLAEQQIKVERFDVDLMGQNPSELPQQSENRSQSQNQRTPTSRGRGRTAAEPITRTVVSAPVRLPGSGQLNIVV